MGPARRPKMKAAVLSTNLSVQLSRSIQNISCNPSPSSWGDDDQPRDRSTNDPKDAGGCSAFQGEQSSRLPWSLPYLPLRQHPRQRACSRCNLQQTAKVTRECREDPPLPVSSVRPWSLARWHTLLNPWKERVGSFAFRTSPIISHPLNPNQPTHIRDAPRTEMRMLWGWN